MFHKFELENVAGCIQVTHAIGIIKKAAQSIFSAIGLGNKTKFKGNNVVYSIFEKNKEYSRGKFVKGDKFHLTPFYTLNHVSLKVINVY